MFKIALDSGHGKNTGGKRCKKSIDPSETREWILNDRICRKIAEKLKSYDGYQLLRVDDTTGATDVALKDRCKKANEFKADLYLSIHHNAGINGGSGGGIVAYTWKKPSTQLQNWQKQFYDALITKTGLKGNRATPLAKSNFYVLVNTDMEALLFENGFMDSTTDVPVILSESFADKAAAAYVETLVKIGGLTKKVPDAPAENKVKYRVQVGSFEFKSNAQNLVEKLKKDGYSAIIVNS
jgi:N-acetylmuramoyl-L-alanine amidase